MTDDVLFGRTPEESATAGNSPGAEWGARPAAAPHKGMGANVTIQKNWQELIRPNKLQVAAGADPKREATVVAEPLERGFGVTLGNALRRILLSSLQGAAVQSVHIDGVLHEFSSIPGVREDVTDIVLNIKDIAIKMQGDGPKRMVVKKQGPGTVTAGDIQTVGDIVVLNPDLVLCTLDEGAEIRMEFTVNTGKGYVPTERNRPEDAPIGLIPVDSLYSPVRKVSYKVENTREGQILDYDKLTMQIETNGAVSPTRSLTPRASCRTSSTSSSTSRSRARRLWPRPFRTSPSIRPSSRRSTSSSFRCVRPTVSRTTISSISAISFRRPRPRCCARRTSGASRSTRSRRCWLRWGFISAWKCRVGRQTISMSWPSASRIIIEQGSAVRSQ
jgi:DNA-directed RNA polymerase alpha subunit